MAYHSSYQCFAYKTLKQQIGQQCRIYRRLHETGDIGSMSRMYTEADLGHTIPTEDTSAFLRGGVITAIAGFEAFVMDLLCETCDTIYYERRVCEGASCLECEQQSRNNHIYMFQKPRRYHKMSKQQDDFIAWKIKTAGVLIHDWNDSFSKILKVEDFFSEIVKDGPIKYFYLIDYENVSRLEIKDSEVACALLRLFYGIRCIIGHGSAEPTLREQKT